MLEENGIITSVNEPVDWVNRLKIVENLTGL